MAREKGKLKVSAKLGGSIKKGRKVLRLPSTYNLAPRELFNNKECEYEIENGQLKVFVDGKELPKDTAAIQKKEESKKRQAEEEERRIKAAAQAKKNTALSRQYGNDSFDVTKAFCPKDTMDLNIQAYEVDNFSLKLNKFARFVKNDQNYSKSKFEFFKSGKLKPEYRIIDNYGDTDFKALIERNKRNAKVLFRENYIVFPKSTSGRLITGLGGASVYETDIVLHHIYGFPYLPGSGIKGVVRSWIIQNVFGDEDKIKEQRNKKNPLINAEFRALTESKEFCKIFGCPSKATKIQLDENGNPIEDERGKVKTKSYDVVLRDKKGKGEENQGNVQFLDAYPINAPKVIPDIMNPHYSDWYEKGIAPTDWQSPKPISFLTVEKQTQFQFILGSKSTEWLNWKIGEKDIIWWLDNALEYHGIGAKTAVGYGYMQ